MTTTRNLIDAIASGDSTAIQTNFEQAVLSRVADNLDVKRQEVAQNMFGEEVESIQEAAGSVHPNGLHVSSNQGSNTYKVHAVGTKFAHGIKVGEHLSDTELDDFAEMGGKIKHIQAQVRKEDLDEVESKGPFKLRSTRCPDCGRKKDQCSCGPNEEYELDESDKKPGSYEHFHHHVSKWMHHKKKAADIENGGGSAKDSAKHWDKVSKHQAAIEDHHGSDTIDHVLDTVSRSSDIQKSWDNRP